MTRTLARWLLAGALVFAGVAHFRLTTEFLGQVPTWFPAPRLVIQVSGVMEVLLGAALLVTGGRRRQVLGVVVGAFFVAVFPGNISQWATGSESFGLETETSRAVRLLFQPLLVAWALWCTGGWDLVRRGRRHA